MFSFFGNVNEEPSESKDEEKAHTETAIKTTNWQKGLDEQYNGHHSNEDDNDNEVNLVNDGDSDVQNSEPRDNVEEEKEKCKSSFFFKVEDPRLMKSTKY